MNFETCGLTCWINIRISIYAHVELCALMWRQDCLSSRTSPLHADRELRCTPKWPWSLWWHVCLWVGWIWMCDLGENTTALILHEFNISKKQVATLQCFAASSHVNSRMHIPPAETMPGLYMRWSACNNKSGCCRYHLVRLRWEAAFHGTLYHILLWVIYLFIKQRKGLLFCLLASSESHIFALN